MERFHILFLNVFCAKDAKNVFKHNEKKNTVLVKHDGWNEEHNIEEISANHDEWNEEHVMSVHVTILNSFCVNTCVVKCVDYKWLVDY